MVMPAEVARRRELLLVDIRPAAERRSELGFLPSSLSLPLVGSLDEQAARLESLRNAAGVILCCTSGRRSALAREALAPRVSFPLDHLDGGQLGWEAAGLPVCRAPIDPVERPADVLAFRRHLVACFVAENTEVALDHDRTQADPYAVLQACFRAADVPWEEPTIEGLYRVLDWAGATTFHAGGDLRHIADNIGTMVAMLQSLEPPSSR